MSCYSVEAAQAALQARTLRLPLVSKPVAGSGSDGIRLIRGLDELAQVGKDRVIQPFLRPLDSDPHHAAVTSAAEAGRILQAAELSYQMVVSHEGKVLGSMATYHRLKAGVPVEILPIDEEPVRQALAPVLPFLLEAGMTGPVNFHGRITAEGPRLFEMNGRFTGITGVRAMMGFNEVEALVVDRLGLRKPPSRLSANRRKVGIRQVLDRCVGEEAHPGIAIWAAPRRGDAPPSPGRCVMVTGATGWLGRHLVRSLIARPAVREVIVVARDVEKAESLFPRQAHGGAKVCIIDAVDATGSVLGLVDVLYHLAGARPPDGSEAVAASTGWTARLFDAAARYDVPAVVFASSQAVYGRSHQVPCGEGLAAAPESPYGMAKFAGEEHLKLLARHRPAGRFASLRIGRIYGAAEGMRREEVPHMFGRKAAMGDPIRILGGGQSFDLLHIDDAVAGLLCLLEGAKWRGVYNLGGGRPVTIEEPALEANAAAKELGGAGAAVEWVEAQAEPMAFGMEIAAFSEDFGWSPRVSLRDGMRGIVAEAMRIASDWGRVDA